MSILDLDESQVVYYLRHVDPDFMMQVLHFLVESQASKVVKLSLIEKMQSNVAHSKRLSLLVAIYCNLHKDDPISLPTLQRLTDDKYLPELDVKAAQALLQLENSISKDYATLTSLKRRCISVLSEQWDHLQLEEGDEGDGALPTSLVSCSAGGSTGKGGVTIPRLEGPALAHFVVRSLTRAKNQLDGMEVVRREWQNLKSQVGSLTEQVDMLMREKNKDSACAGSWTPRNEEESTGRGTDAKEDGGEEGEQTKIVQVEAAVRTASPSITSSAHARPVTQPKEKVDEPIRFF